MTDETCQNCYYLPFDLWEDEPCINCNNSDRWRKIEPLTCYDCMHAKWTHGNGHVNKIGECTYNVDVKEVLWPFASLVDTQSFGYKRCINTYTEHECPCWNLDDECEQ